VGRSSAGDQQSACRKRGRKAEGSHNPIPCLLSYVNILGWKAAGVNRSLRNGAFSALTPRGLPSGRQR
jgi:hypothetical protein